MKTISDFKNRIQVGVPIKTQVFHKVKESDDFVLVRDWAFRKVSLKQSNSFALKTEKITGTKIEFFDSYCEWPKKDQFSVIDDNTVKISLNFSYIIYQFL